LLRKNLRAFSSSWPNIAEKKSSRLTAFVAHIAQKNLCGFAPLR